LAVNRTDPEVLRLKEEVSRLPDQLDESEQTVVAQALPSVEEPNASDAVETRRLPDEIVEPTVVMETSAVEPDIAETTEVVSLPIEEPPVTVVAPNEADATVMELLVEATVVMEAFAVEPDIAEATEVMSLPVEPTGASISPDEPDVPVVDEPADDDLATLSLADLYVAQGHYDQGIAIYRRLLDQTPTDGEIAAKLDNALTLARLLAPTPVDADEVKSEVVSHVLSGGEELGIEHADEGSQASVVGAAAGASRHQAAIHRLELWLARIEERRHR
jgi:hypothetical protein